MAMIMLKLLLYGVLAFIGLVLLGLGCFLYYAARPALSEQQLPRVGVRVIGPPTDAPAVPPDRLRLVTYNIGYASGFMNNLGPIVKREEHDRYLEQIVATLRALRPDIVGLQEMDFFARRSFDVNQLEYIAARLGLPYVAHVVTWNLNYLPWPYWPPQLHYGRIVSGQAVLSRYPIVKHRVHTFPKPSEQPFWKQWFYLDRVVQQATIQIGAQPLIVWHTHLEAFEEGTRVQQAEQLGAMVAAANTPWQFVLGDLNSVSQWRPDVDLAQRERQHNSRAALDRLVERGGLRNAEPHESMLTYPSWDAIRKLDHILSTPSLPLRDAGVVTGVLASDHLPVWAEYAIPR